MQQEITIKDSGKDEVKSVITFFMETKGWVLRILNLGSNIMMRIRMHSSMKWDEGKTIVGAWEVSVVIVGWFGVVGSLVKGLSKDQVGCDEIELAKSLVASNCWCIT